MLVRKHRARPLQPLTLHPLSRAPDCLKNETLTGLVAELESDRKALLSKLKALGVSKLGDRQEFCNAIGRAKREGRLRPSGAVGGQAASDADIESLSVKQLKELIREAGLDSSDCVEKDQLKARAREAQAAQVYAQQAKALNR